MSREAPAVSAHRRDTDDEPTALARALATGAEYIELDIRRTATGDLVIRHNPLGNGPHYPLRDALKLLQGRATAHLDLKETGAEHEIVAHAQDLLGTSFVITTKHMSSIEKIKSAHPEITCALSVGRSPRDKGFRDDLNPVPRLRACGADWVALNYRLAALGVLRRCANAGIPAMLWTINSPRLLRHYLNDPRVAVVITDHPSMALALRLTRTS